VAFDWIGIMITSSRLLSQRPALRPHHSLLAVSTTRTSGVYSFRMKGPEPFAWRAAYVSSLAL